MLCNIVIYVYQIGVVIIMNRNNESLIEGPKDNVCGRLIKLQSIILHTQN